MGLTAVMICYRVMPFALYTGFLFVSVSASS